MKQRLLGLLSALSMFTILVLPASAEISLSAVASSISDGGETATLQVTFTCTYTGSYSVSGEVNQKSGRGTNYGNGGAHGECEANQQVIAYLNLTSQSERAFRPGPADVSITVFNWDDGSHDDWENRDMDTGRLTTAIRLKK